MKWIEPDWPAPANVRALSTTRDGGVSEGVFAGLNLGAHVGDELARVEANRGHLQRIAAIPAPLNWLNQVHGTVVHPVSCHYEQAPDADAACAHEVEQACIVMTADCLPVLFCDRAGTVVAAAHAGWRGLKEGVLEASIAAMACDPVDILAWLGPAIGPTAFEVGGGGARCLYGRAGRGGGSLCALPQRGQVAGGYLPAGPAETGPRWGERRVRR